MALALRLYKTKDNLISFFGDTNVLLFMLLIKNSSREIYIWLSKMILRILTLQNLSFYQRKKIKF